MCEESSASKPVSYFVDFENVHNEGLDGIEQLDENSQVIIFYSKKANTIMIDQALNVFSSKADVSFVKIDNGTPNALDFQLTTMLIATISHDREYVIVSADTGYEAVIKMAHRLGLPPISRWAKIARKGAVSVNRATTHPTHSSPGERASSAHFSPGENAASKGQADHEGLPSSEALSKESGRDESASDEFFPGEALAAITPGEVPAPEEGPTAIATNEVPLEGDGVGSPLQVEALADGAMTDWETTAEEQLNDQDATSKSQVPAGKEASAVEASVVEKGVPAKKDAPRQTKGMKKRDLVNKELEAAGVKLKQQQLSNVMNALNSTRKKHDFYIQIIRAEGQQAGLSLYRRISSLYDKLSSIVC